MRLCILSRSPRIYTTRRLTEAAMARGLDVALLDPMRCEMFLDGKAAQLFYDRKRLRLPELVVPRIAPSIGPYGLAVVTQFEMRGVPMLNDADAIARSRNKMRCLQLLSTAGIDIPATVMASQADDLKEMVKLVGGVPVLVKLIAGNEKLGVMVCESLQSMEAALEAVLKMGHNLLVQEYVRRARGSDIRALVVGGEVVAAVRRKARVGQLSRTLSRGAQFEQATLDRSQIAVAVKATSVIGLEVAAVDLLDLRGGPKVSEVNSSPGLKEMEAATGLDLATPIIARAVSLLGERPRAQGAVEMKPVRRLRAARGK